MQPSPLDDDLLFDTLILGGDVWPGIATVETTKARDLDTPKKKGEDGNTLEDQGSNPATLKITLRMWLAEHWKELNRLLPTIDPQVKAGVRSPLDIVHPEPNLKGVNQIYVKQINPTTASKGEIVQTFEAIQWFPAPKPVKKTAKSKTSKTGGAIPSPADVVPPSKDGSVKDNII